MNKTIDKQEILSKYFIKRLEKLVSATNKEGQKLELTSSEIEEVIKTTFGLLSKTK